MYYLLESPHSPDSKLQTKMIACCFTPILYCEVSNNQNTFILNLNKDTLILWNTICIFISDNRLFEIWSLWNLYECKYMKCVQCRKVKSTVFTNTNINVWPLAIHDGLSYEHSLSPLIIANSFNKKKFRIYFIWGKWNIM